MMSSPAPEAKNSGDKNFADAPIIKNKPNSPPTIRDLFQQHMRIFAPKGIHHTEHVAKQNVDPSY